MALTLPCVEIAVHVVEVYGVSPVCCAAGEVLHRRGAANGRHLRRPRQAAVRGGEGGGGRRQG